MCGGGAAFSSPLSRSGCFCEPVLLNSLRDPQWLSLPRGRTSWLELASLKYFPFSGQLGSGYLVSLERGPVKEDRVQWPSSKWFLFSSPTLEVQGDFFLIFVVGVWLSSRRSQHCRGLPSTWGDPGVFNSQARLPWAPNNLPITLPVFSPGSLSCCVSLHSPFICLLFLCPGSNILFCISPSLWIHKGLLIFASLRVFTCCYQRVAASKLLTNGSRKC